MVQLNYHGPAETTKFVLYMEGKYILCLLYRMSFKRGSPIPVVIDITVF